MNVVTHYTLILSSQLCSYFPSIQSLLRNCKPKIRYGILIWFTTGHHLWVLTHCRNENWILFTSYEEFYTCTREEIADLRNIGNHSKLLALLWRRINRARTRRPFLVSHTTQAGRQAPSLTRFRPCFPSEGIVLTVNIAFGSCGVDFLFAGSTDRGEYSGHFYPAHSVWE